MEVSVVFLKIGEIDTLKEQYEADVLIQSKWREPSLDKDKVQVCHCWFLFRSVKFIQPFI